MSTRRKANKFAIAIAKDVLKQLKKFNLSRGQFIRPRDDFYLLPLVADLQQCVADVQANCNVCQKGALLLSKARLYNDVPIDTARKIMFNYCDESGLIKDSLQGYVDRESLDLLEAAFECDSFSWMNNADRGRIEIAIEFGSRYKSLRGRIKACMENMIENNGYFVPEKGLAKKKVKKVVAS